MRFINFLRNLLRRSRVERDLDDELRATMDLLVDEKVRAACRQTPPAAPRSADWAARQRSRTTCAMFEPAPSSTRCCRMYGSGHDSCAAIPSSHPRRHCRLRLASARTTTIFTVADALLFRAPAGVREADRLVDVGHSAEGFRLGTVSYRNYFDLRQRASTLSGTYAYSVMPSPMSLAAGNGAERIYGDSVSSNFFERTGDTAGRRAFVR